MKSLTRMPRERIAAILALVLAVGLGTYAAASSFASPAPHTADAPAPILAASTAAEATPAPTELLITTTTTDSPVKSDARAADEPPSRPAVVATPARKPAVTAPRTRTIRMEVTAYCACRECCGPKACGLTASGRPVSYNRGKFVAADTTLLPFGTRLVIPGYNNSRPVPVADRGGAIQGRRLDLFFPTHKQALQWGRQTLTVTVLED